MTPAAAQQAVPIDHPRLGAVASPEMINTFEDAILPEKSKAGARHSASAPTPRLLVKAWVNNVAYEKKVWVEVDLVGSSGKPLQSSKLPLGYAEAAGGSGDFFLVEAPVHPGSPARRGPVQLLEYRLYYEVGGQVFTDGVPHRHQLPAKTADKTAAKNGTAHVAQAKARRASPSRGR